MKKYLIALCLMCIPLLAHAQANLVPNPGFEDDDWNCQGAKMPKRQLDFAKDWFIAKITAELFKDCNGNRHSPNDFVDDCPLTPPLISHAEIPYNDFGLQQPYEGEQYAGAYIRRSFGNDGFKQEVFGVELNYAMDPDRWYKIEFYASLGDHSTYGADIPVFFTDKWPNPGHTFEVDINGASIVTDKDNWTKVEYYYKAVGCEEYLFIGWLGAGLGDIELAAPPYWECPSPSEVRLAIHPDDIYSYYYIDAVTVNAIPVGDDWPCQESSDLEVELIPVTHEPHSSEPDVCCFRVEVTNTSDEDILYSDGIRMSTNSPGYEIVSSTLPYFPDIWSKDAWYVLSGQEQPFEANTTTTIGEFCARRPTSGEMLRVWFNFLKKTSPPGEPAAYDFCGIDDIFIECGTSGISNEPEDCCEYLIPRITDVDVENCEFEVSVSVDLPEPTTCNMTTLRIAPIDASKDIAVTASEPLWTGSSPNNDYAEFSYAGSVSNGDIVSGRIRLIDPTAPTAIVSSILNVQILDLYGNVLCEKHITVTCDYERDLQDINPGGGTGKQPLFELEHGKSVDTPSLTVAPNPAQEFVDIKYSVIEASEATLTIFNMLGEKVETLVRATEHRKGVYSVHYQTDQLTPGVYYIQLSYGDQFVTTPLTIADK